MAASSPWPTIHSQRQALADDLADLEDARWSTPSLVPEWTVCDVLAHMTATAKMTAPLFFTRLAAAGFRFNEMAAKNIARERAVPPAELLAEFRRHQNATTSPPGPADTWLGEVIVHSEDIRRPLGIAHSYPVEAVTRAADFYKRSNLLIGSKRRIAGLTLRATDTEWSTGDGPEVTGPVLSLLLAMTGRKDAVRDLSGDGLATLRARM